MSGHQPLFFNIQINFCREQNIYTKRSIHTCLLSYLPEIDIEISTKPAFLNVVTEGINNFCCSTLYSFTEYFSLIALLRLFCQLQSLFFVSPNTGQLPDLLHFHSDVIQSLVSGHVFLHIHNFKFTFVSLFWIFEVYFVIHDPPMQCILVWCQIKDVIALIATLILQQQLLNYLFFQTTLDWLFY